MIENIINGHSMAGRMLKHIEEPETLLGHVNSV